SVVVWLQSPGCTSPLYLPTMAAVLFMPCCHCPITPKSCLLAPHWLLLNAAPLCLASWLLPLAPWLAPGYGRE
ncbi:hypothetical protein V8C86DRAFT_2741898, partial [Haematococcus lacustris]